MKLMSSQTFARVLFIGLDSAEPDLVLKWAAEGLLPGMRAIMENGVWGRVTGPKGFGNGVVWPSLFTGANPGKHGRYFHRQFRADKYNTARFDESRDLKRRPFWETLSDSGRRVAVVDMVRAPLSSRLNGIQVADWATHDRTSAPRSLPPELIAEITSGFGSDPLDGNSENAGRSPEEFRALRDALIARIGTKADLSEHLLQQGPWDLFATVFADPHDIGHQAWHLHDESHPLYSAEYASRYGNPLLDVYREADRVLSRLIDKAGPEATVVVFTGPGMGVSYTGNELLDETLRRLEKKPGNHSIRVKSPYRSIVPGAVRTKIGKGIFKALADRADGAVVRYDRSRRKCFAAPHNQNSGAVRVNLIGRESRGKIRPGAEYDAFCDALAADLLELRNLDTGRPVVREVVRVHQEFRGEHLNDLPDLLVVWERSDPIRGITSEKIGEVVGGNPFLGSRTGDHTPNCLLLAGGPGIAPARLEGQTPVEAIAPTLCALLGVSMSGTDASPIDAITGVWAGS